MKIENKLIHIQIYLKNWNLQMKTAMGWGGINYLTDMTSWVTLGKWKLNYSWNLNDFWRLSLSSYCQGQGLGQGQGQGQFQGQGQGQGGHMDKVEFSTNFSTDFFRFDTFIKTSMQGK